MKTTAYKLLGTTEELFISIARSDLLKLKKEPIEKSLSEPKPVKKFRSWRSNQSARYYCKMCPFTSDAKFDFLVHLNTKHKERARSKMKVPIKYMIPGDDLDTVLFKCVECLYTSDSKWVFNNHLLVHKSSDETEMFSCPHCSYATKRRGCLQKHVRRHLENSGFLRCRLCPYGTYMKPNLLTHMRVTHDASRRCLECAVCGFKTKYLSSLRKHSGIHSKHRQRYKCPDCDFTTHHLESLNLRHRLKHISKEATAMFYCAHCDYKTNVKSHLPRHFRTHVTEKLEECPDCPHKSKTKEALFHHRKMMHRVFDRPFPCDSCHYVGRTMWHLKQHKKVHLDPSVGKMYQCNKCSYRSRASGNVKRHMLNRHTDLSELTMFRCEQCDYVAKTPERLKAHFNTVHKDPSQIKWYECDTCEQKFKNKGNLKRHMGKHEIRIKVVRYLCKGCDFEGKKADDLINHQVIHSDLFHCCDECGFMSKYLSGWYKHRKQRHGKGRK